MGLGSERSQMLWRQKREVREGRDPESRGSRDRVAGGRQRAWALRLCASTLTSTLGLQSATATCYLPNCSLAASGSAMSRSFPLCGARLWFGPKGA
jgi:hypothetical protein